MDDILREIETKHERVIERINSKLEEIEYLRYNEIEKFKVKYFKSKGFSKNPLTYRYWILPDEAKLLDDYVRIEEEYNLQKDDLEKKIQIYLNSILSDFIRRI